MLRAVIVDIDGTLVDSVDLRATVWQEALGISAARSLTSKSATDDQLTRVFFSEDELNRFGEEMEEYCDESYKRDCVPLVRPFRRVRELLLRVCADDGHRIALASSAKGMSWRHTKSSRRYVG